MRNEDPGKYTFSKPNHHLYEFRALIVYCKSNTTFHHFLRSILIYFVVGAKKEGEAKGMFLTAHPHVCTRLLSIFSMPHVIANGVGGAVSFHRIGV